MLTSPFATFSDPARDDFRIFAHHHDRLAPLLQSFVATHVSDRNLSAGDLRAEVNNVTGGPVFPVYDAIPLPETQIAAYGLLAPNGKHLTVLPDSVGKEPVRRPFARACRRCHPDATPPRVR